MAGINRVGSPMDLIDERFEQSKEKLEKHKKSLELKQRTQSPMIDNIGGPRRVNNFLTTLNVPPVCNKNLKVMERRAGEVVEMVADVSARNAAQDAYQKEMMEIAEHESSEAAAEMECFEKDLGVGLMLHPSPSERHILQSSLNTDDTSEWTDVDEDESNTWNQNPKGNQAPKKMKDQTKSTHDAVTLKARKRLSSKFTCKTRRGMSCAVDTAWQKRGFDSSTSHTFFMSKKKFGNKVVKAVVKHKTCGTCKWWKRNRPGCKVRKHRCVANHSGSSRMMESVSGEQGLDELHKSGTPVEFIEGDGDSTLMARVREKYPDLKKRYDKNHVVKNVTKAIYNLQASKKTSLSKIAVQHIKKCLSYSISKNQGNKTALKDNLKALIPHQFGDHSLCQDTFCGEKKTPGEKYVHKSLPHKMALKDDGSVRSCLEAIIAPVAANAGAYADIGCSQQCEHANREVTLRAPKSHHYGDSESLDFRVKATAACINEGRHYICQAYSEAGLSPGMYTQKYADQRMKERVREQYTSSQPSTKRRRLILKQERATNNSSLEVMEGATYQSGIDLEPSADIQKIPDAVPRAEFKPVACPQSMTVITMDLETTDLTFLIGSIEEVNKKISKLDRKLQQYTQLIAESRASDRAEEQLIRGDRPKSSVGREIIERKEREQRELNRFAGYYTLKQTFLPGRSERVRNISKISMSPSKQAQTKKDSGKPKFVELHQYPGYDPVELTALPDEVPAKNMLIKAADAEMDLYKKPQFRPLFEKWFYSPMSQAVFQDIFWYMFLDKYQASKNAQIKLFNRAAFNYVKLLMYVKDPMYRDVFFTDYPSLISQAIYAAFCHCFPDSYRQFGEDFKEDLVALVYGWIAGIKPAPRVWGRWNMDKLEPPNIKMREEILNTKKKTSSTGVNFDFLDSLISSNISRYASSASLSQSASNYSAHSGKGKGRRRSKYGRDRKSASSRVPSSSESSSTHEDSPDHMKSASGSQRKSATKPKQVDPRKLVEALTPIRETTFEDYEDMDSARDKMSQSEQVIKMMATANRIERKPLKESHPACRGPDTTKSTFNLYGQSPLVAHFLRVKNLTREAGQSVHVQRTEQENPPPLDAPTYRDLIKESFKKVREAEKQYQEIYEKNLKESIAFSQSQRQIKKDHIAKELSLLSQPNEVKRLSDLLMLEFRRDPESLSTGAYTALEQALMAQ